jgi:hypothetical protein
LTRIRRGGYVFVTWTGDHEPRHVHVYRDDRLVLKWDLVKRRAIIGVLDRRILLIIEVLLEEGRL